MKLWQNPLNKTSSKGGKEVQRQRTQLWNKKTIPKWDVKGQKNKLCSKTPLVTRSISKKERKGKLDRIVNLEKPSLATTKHFKIEMACAICKVIDTLCLYKTHKTTKGGPPMPFVDHAILAYQWIKSLVGASNQKPLWQGEKTCPSSVNCDKVFPLHELPLL